MDSRAQVFTSWLASLNFDDESLQEITPAQALPLLDAFIHAVANEGFSKTRALTLTAATISGHLQVARNWLAAELGVVVDISADDGTPKLHPFLANTLAARQAWTAPKPKREPFTSDMFTYMFDDISKCAAAKPSILFDAEIKVNKMLGDSGVERVATLTTADSLEGRTIQSSIGCISSRIVSLRPVSQ